MSARSMRVALLGLLTASALLPAPASAEFHLVSIREVFPGDGTGPDAEFVELQAYAPGQHIVAGHTVTFRNAGGAIVGSESFAANVADGSNQMTILMATAAAQARFGPADEEIAPNLLDPAGGAVCWESLDCVAWGAFSGPLPSAAGAPASPAGIADGMALRRSISRGCSTLLELTDDTDDSAADFAEVFPAPRPNSVAPSERPCGASGGGGGGGPGSQGGKGAPQTRLRGKPPRRTTDRTPTFRFRSQPAGARFQCRVDGGRYRGCRSPFTTRRLSFGAHVFRVRARDGGRVDETPAVFRFRVVRRRG